MSMSSDDMLLYLIVLVTFAAVVVLTLGIGKMVSDRQLRGRISQVVGLQKTPRSKLDAGISKPSSSRTADLMESLSRLSLPADGWQDSQLKLKFIRAGFRGQKAPQTYFGIKSLLFIVAPLVLGATLFVLFPGMGFTKIAALVVFVAAAGYYLPDVYLRLRTSRRSRQMRETLPDLIDLLVICIESGLGLDAALNRVSREISRASPVLAEEFYLAGLEIRAGSGRVPALKNLSLRVDLEDLYNLVAMLVQADKFGTSLGASLRIQSEVMRVKRMQRAEEIASKIPVKMLFPLIFFIFPSLMFVIIGPAAIQVSAMFAK